MGKRDEGNGLPENPGEQARPCSMWPLYAKRATPCGAGDPARETPP